MGVIEGGVWEGQDHLPLLSRPPVVNQNDIDEVNEEWCVTIEDE
jgi:hypothetical protein